MEKILIVTDTTSGMNFDDAKRYNIELIPLSLIIDGVEYKDHLDISTQEFYQYLEAGATPTTSQPNVGYVEERMKVWKEECYEAIIIITISSYLSGTYQGFQMIAQQQEMDNLYLVDSKTVGGPIMDGAITARKLVDEGKGVKEILNVLEEKFSHTLSFLYPQSLTQLKKGGRISPLAANMASLLKIKPLLMLKKDGTIIDKYAVSRTESKLFEMIMQAFIEEGVCAKTHRLYICHAQGEATIERIQVYLQAHLPEIETKCIVLPAVLCAHGGLGCVALQSIKK